MAGGFGEDRWFPGGTWPKECSDICTLVLDDEVAGLYFYSLLQRLALNHANKLYSHRTVCKDGLILGLAV